MLVRARLGVATKRPMTFAPSASHWVDCDPLTWTRPNLSGCRVTGRRDVPDMLLPDMVAGKSPGMKKVISEDSMHRALVRMNEQPNCAW